MIFGLLLRDIKNNISLLKGHGEWDFKKFVKKTEYHACFQTGCLHDAGDVLTLDVLCSDVNRLGCSRYHAVKK